MFPFGRKKKPAFSNEELGMLAAKSLLLRGLAVHTDSLVRITAFSPRVLTSRPYTKDARGGKGYVDFLALASFWSGGRLREALALLLIECDTDEHEWRPNMCGTYVCVDGNEFFEIRADYLSGNIELFNKEGHGMHVPDDFRERAAAIPWAKLAS
jgi:hypothetical protein